MKIIILSFFIFSNLMAEPERASFSVNGLTVTQSDEVTLKEMIHSVTGPLSERIIEKVVIKLKRQESKEWSPQEFGKMLSGLGFYMGSLRIVLPQKIIVRRTGDYISKDDLEDMIRAKLRPNLPAKVEPVISLKSDMKPIEAMGDVKLGISFNKTLPINSDFVEVQTFVNGSVVSRKWIPCEFRYYSQVPVAARNIGGLSKLNLGDYKWERREVTASLNTLVSPQDLNDGFVKGMVAAGQVIQLSLLERNLAIHRGDEVSVIAESPDLSVTVKGVAESNGAIGETIRVKTSENKVITGVVKDRGEVNVQF